MKKIIYIDGCSKWTLDIFDENKERVTHLNNYNYGDELLCFDFNDDGTQIPKEGKYIECIVSNIYPVTIYYLGNYYIDKKWLIYHGKMFWSNILEYYHFGHKAKNEKEWLDSNWRRSIEMRLFL